MSATDIKAIQQALLDKGYDPGPVDGVWGRKTIAAVRAFQQAAGLEVDGIYGPQTAARLLPSAPLGPYSAPWMAEAARLYGLREGAGAADNPEIINFAKVLDIPYANDEVPWCGLFVGHCIGATLPQEPLPTGLLSARSWTTLGSRTEPRVGAVMVFWRKSPDAWEGHVGFYAGQRGSQFLILGGNQNDSVSYAWQPRANLLGARWPFTALSLEGLAKVVEVGADAASSRPATLA